MLVFMLFSAPQCQDRESPGLRCKAATTIEFFRQGPRRVKLVANVRSK